MEFAVKSEMMSPSAEIRPLSDAELDAVDGGSIVAVLCVLAAFTVGVAVGATVANGNKGQC